MKRVFAGFIASFVAALPFVSRAEPARLSIEQNGSAVELEINDPENGMWVLEGAMELGNWTSLKLLHVRNTNLAVASFSTLPEAAGYRFFRVRSSMDSPDLSTVGMLDLGDTPYAYDRANRPPGVFARIIPAVTIDNNKAALGRVLFYDKRLSANNSVSCASCHQQEHAFSDPRRFSIGHSNKPTPRNTPSLLHVRTYDGKTGLFMDGRSPNLITAVGEPILHLDEMGSTELELIAKIESEPYYGELFQAAFPAEPISLPNIRGALEHFVLSLPSFSSKYDQGRVLGRFENFSNQELVGKSLFEAHCSSCHRSDTFTASAFMSNGLDLQPLDPGRQAVTANPSDHGKFRPPSLRDIAETAPYMHDGRFASLREVLDFYNSGVKLHANLSAPLDGTPMNLSDAHLAALEAFLKTLTDTESLTNPAFSDPFRDDTFPPH